MSYTIAGLIVLLIPVASFWATMQGSTPPPTPVYNRPVGNCIEVTTLLSNRPLAAIHSYARDVSCPVTQ